MPKKLTPPSVPTPEPDPPPTPLVDCDEPTLEALADAWVRELGRQAARECLDMWRRTGKAF